MKQTTCNIRAWPRPLTAALMTVAAGAMCLTAPARGQEKGAPDAFADQPAAQPPAAGREVRVGPDGAVEFGEANLEKGAWMGVGVSRVPTALGKQLRMPKGTGLVVGVVEPEGPADKAGLQEDDVIQKLNDQILVNEQQLDVLVRTFKVGDEVKLGIIREGKPQTITVKLVAHELL